MAKNKELATITLTPAQWDTVQWLCESPFGAKIRDLVRIRGRQGKGTITGTRDAFEDLDELVINSAYHAGFKTEGLSTKLGRAIDKLWEKEDAAAVARLAEIDRKDAERARKARKAA